jgi:L-ascorbate metabolism protein UlaG (beta-lactamase superfamily)
MSRSRIAAVAVVGTIVAGSWWLNERWQERHDANDLGWPTAESSVDQLEGVSVTWLGVSTLLFDDGETQILIDGYITRIGLERFLAGNVETDIASVNRIIAELRIERLAAIIPSHSHFDHAMDVGVIANRSTAVVLGSESTANIVRGANLPVSQYQILADGEERRFGAFGIRLLVSAHAPLLAGGDTFFAGLITEPLVQPAPISEWKSGTVYSIVLEHPRGTVVVQSSAGFVPDKLTDVDADVVFLGIAGLSQLGEEHARRYWAETVTKTNATTVYPIHYEDFTRPLGEIILFPAIVDDVRETASWINDLAAFGNQPVEVLRLPFGERVVIF